MDLNKPLWIGSTVDVRQGQDAEKALSETSDAKYWSDTTGITRVDRERWERAQKYERECWMQHSLAARSDRNDEHYAGFNGYTCLKKDLGEVVEIGCGPFTQLSTILTKADRTASHITLVDPLIREYQEHPHCTYRDGKLAGVTVGTREAIPAEEFAAKESYDTAICINVLEHVQDATSVLNNLYDCLKYGGAVIFHDRAWDHIDINKIYDAGHPIRLKKVVLESFISRFNVIHKNNDYFIGEK